MNVTLQRRVFLLAIILLGPGVQALPQQPRQPWSAFIFSEGKADKAGKRLELRSVQQNEFQLLGTIFLFRPAGNQGHGQPSVMIEGHSGPDGLFLPNVLLEVGDGSENGWTTVESSLSPNKSVTLVVDARTATEGIGVQLPLDAFQPSLGKDKYGRITLQTGERVEFPLGYLSREGFKPEVVTPNDKKPN